MLFYGFLGGGLIMLGAAAVEWWLGIDSEGKGLEDVATPLSAQRPEESPPLPREPGAPAPGGVAAQGTS